MSNEAASINIGVLTCSSIKTLTDLLSLAYLAMHLVKRTALWTMFTICGGLYFDNHVLEVVMEVSLLYLLSLTYG